MVRRGKPNQKKQIQTRRRKLNEYLANDSDTWLSRLSKALSTRDRCRSAVLDAFIRLEEYGYTSKKWYYGTIKKGFLQKDPEEAIANFHFIIRMKPEDVEWGFSSLKQCVKLLYKLEKYEDMMEHYEWMLTYTKSAVTRNDSGKCINNVVKFVYGSAFKKFDLLLEFHQTTLAALEDIMKERFWFKTNFKLCKICLDIREYPLLNQILGIVYDRCRKEDGTEDEKKGTQLLEAYAIDIQRCTVTRDTESFKELYSKALSTYTAIHHPRIMGIIWECGGKMHMLEGHWDKAANDFFEAFDNYEDAGNYSRECQCLKYLGIANMLMGSEYNPFDGIQEKPYGNNLDVVAMNNLFAAYQQNDILAFKNILEISGDQFNGEYVDDLLKTVRIRVWLALIETLAIPFISKNVNVSEQVVVELLVSLIEENRIQGHIDQANV